MRPLRAFLATVGIAIVLTAASCEKKGPAERAGEKVDNAVATAGQAVENTGDKVKEAVE